jgi:hypothetical protein
VAYQFRQKRSIKENAQLENEIEGFNSQEEASAITEVTEIKRNIGGPSYWY